MNNKVQVKVSFILCNVLITSLKYEVVNGINVDFLHVENVKY